MASAIPNIVTAIGPQTTELTVTYSIATSAPAGTVVSGNIVAFGPLTPSGGTVVVPNTEVWHLIDLYVAGAPVGPDAFVVTTLNGYQQNFQPKLSSMNLNLLTRFRLASSIPYIPNSSFSTSLVTLAAAGASGPYVQVLSYEMVKSPIGA